MRRLLFPFAACGVLALLCGCASQVCRVHEYYEPTEATLKSETIKSGQPDWSGNKHFSLFSW